MDLPFLELLNLCLFLSPPRLQCGFFKRSRYDDSVPRYHAVRIRKEEREIQDEKYNDNPEKKQWITKWNENESYS